MAQVPQKGTSELFWRLHFQNHNKELRKMRNEKNLFYASRFTLWGSLVIDVYFLIYFFVYLEDAKRFKLKSGLCAEYQKLAPLLIGLQSCQLHKKRSMQRKQISSNLHSYHIF